MSTTSSAIAGNRPRSVDHRTSTIHLGRPADRFHRVARPASASIVPSRRAPSYAARRVGVAVAAIISMVAVGALVVAALVSFGGDPALAAEATPVGPPAVEATAGAETHVARDGDSLWSIADEHRGDVDRQSYLRALIDLNGSASVAVGQGVILP